MVFGLFEGNLELYLDNTVFQEGGQIGGRVKLKLKGPKNSRGLKLEFYGEITEKSVRMGSKGTRTSSATRRIGQQTMMLKGEGTYADGEEYPFTIQIPKGMMPEMPAMPSGILGSVIGVMASMAPRPRWYVSATLEIPGGIDMNKRLEVQLSK